MNSVGFFNETDETVEETEEIKKVIHYALDNEKLKYVVFNIIFVDDLFITSLNQDYRGMNSPTDVISFALEDNLPIDLGKYRLLGDIYISVDTAKRQAINYGHSLLRELSFLAVHGLLHLLGYDHINEDEEKIMFEKQEWILDGYGIKR
ncbi:MAG: rRNA maturation RNase YbeY [Bacilli bacterium]|nr:rRNA maturation RNase YbeY [Bacilli bacterium]MDD4282610.1 rRNA maturation RNase YbeY [Bacilli bacterium]MDD4718520.1 rRNA maturation RNase YbeY [Bacilli bacterium]